MPHKKLIIEHITPQNCNKCGGDTNGFKCPKCAKTSAHYDPHHIRTCKYGAKMRAQCKKCMEAEDNCTCA